MFKFDSSTGGAQLFVKRKASAHALHSTSSKPASEVAVDYLTALEAESIYILREVAAEFERPALLFSGGKDSITLLRLAEKAFRPGAFPFPLVHVDTGHNFPEVLEFRDQLINRLEERLIVASVDEGIASGSIRQSPGEISRNRLQTSALLSIIEKHKFDAAIGGARRDEEKARAKERIFSFRDTFGQWDPRNQRPELWKLYNARIHPSEHMRVFPLSNWTELDVWQYIEREHLAVPSIYFAHEREVIERDGQLLPVSEYLPLKSGERSLSRRVRMRTVGDMTCTGCHESDATSVPDIIGEIASMKVTERGSRTDDQRSESAMEDRKREGYF
jgi:sulfate adenylyltransferase subunit 2